MVNRCWLNGHVITYHTPTFELRQISEKSTHFQLATNQLATNQLLPTSMLPTSLLPSKAC
jgi:hypothetical protein